MALTLADGQLPAVAAAIFSGSPADANRVNISCQNTSGSLPETVALTFQRKGGTARRIARAILQANEQLLVTGLPVEAGDTVLGVTSDGATVDYLVSRSDTDPYSIQTLDANGSKKQVATIAGGNQSVTGILTVNGLTTGNITPLTVNGAINPHTAKTYAITKAGVLADTLAAPTAVTDDGVQIVIASDNDNAHTLTATGLLDTGSAATDVATFAPFKGAGLTLEAYNGRWKVLSSTGITFS